MLLFNHEASEAVGENRRLTTFWRQRKTGNFICASESKLGFTMSSGWITQSYLLFLFLFIHLSWSNLTGSSANAFNVASVSYEELIASSKYHRYSNPNIIHFAQVWIDKPRNQILVGARDYLVRLSIRNLERKEMIPWPSENRTVNICRQKGQKPEDCHNFVRVLLVHNNRVFTCGTNSFYPRCSWRRVDLLTHEEDQLDGQAMCPYSPHHNSTFLMTGNGDYYSATTMDFTGSDPAIYRIMGPSPRLRTAQYNSKWLNEPDFVSAFEIGDFVYFFFRETAVEFANCGMAVYSRVARMCKNDVGGDFLLRDTWTTFLKARLNCSIEGKVPFYYNHLQDVFYEDDAQTFYGVFTTGANDVAGSAVCAYSLTNVDIAFKGSFTYQENLKSTWQAVQNPNAGISQCAGGGSRTRRQEDRKFRNLVDAQRYQLMQLPVAPLDPAPMMKQDGGRWTHVVADKPLGKGTRRFTVVFVTTLEGRLQKMVTLGGGGGMGLHCLVEDVALFPASHTGAILTMKIVPEESAIVIGTENSLIKVPLERCHRHVTRQLCISAQDPYCGWDSFSSSCASRPSDTRLHWWHQEVTSCPTNDAPIDGRYSNWTAWYTCPNQDGDTCLCRVRGCDSPAPVNGGRACQGHSVQVANCTVNGGWTSWTDWSACSATCGLATRVRKRTCTNPQPAFGGSHCRGSDLEEEVCTEVPETCGHDASTAMSSRWGPWGKWRECSRNCGGGFQKRQRICSRDIRGSQCGGNDAEFRECNIGPCEEVRKSSGWTSWVRSLNLTSSGGGFVEQRFRIGCRAQVPYPSMLKVGPVKRQLRVCAADGARGGVTCSSPSSGPTVPDVTDVSRPRSWPPPAEDPPNYDDENPSQLMPSDMDKISTWTPWSMWTACSVSCGGGVRVRYRSCKGTICQGSSNDIAACNRGRCPDSDGWSEWSAWSACGSDDQQHRYRRCMVSHPTYSQCKGGYAEARICTGDPDFDNDVPDPSHVSSAPAGGAGFSTLHLVLAAVAGFALGGVTCVGVLLCCQTQIKRGQAQGSLHNNNNSKASNLYVATPLPYAPSTPNIHKNSFHTSATVGGGSNYVSAASNHLGNHHVGGSAQAASVTGHASSMRDPYTSSPMNSNNTIARNFSTLPSRNGSEKSRNGNCATINRNGTLNRNGSLSKRDWTLTKAEVKKRNSLMQQLNAENMRTNLNYDDL